MENIISALKRKEILHDTEANVILATKSDEVNISENDNSPPSTATTIPVSVNKSKKLELKKKTLDIVENATSAPRRKKNLHRNDIVANTRSSTNRKKHRDKTVTNARSTTSTKFDKVN